MIKVKIKEEFIKLDSLLKLSGLVSTGGEAKTVINEGLVKVDDEICTMRGKKIRKGNIAEYNGEKVTVE